MTQLGGLFLYSAIHCVPESLDPVKNLIDALTHERLRLSVF